MALFGEKYIREDNLTVNECPLTYPFVVAIADGMGGHAGGKVASETVLHGLQEKINSVPPKIWEDEAQVPGKITEVVSSLHTEILKQSNEEPELKKMGTTLSGVVISAQGQMFLFHVGDTRVYRFRHGELLQLTRDHSMNGDGHSFSSNVLVNAIGGGIERFYVDVEQIDKKIQDGDMLLLSSDGLHDKVTGEELIKVLEGSERLEAKSARLLEIALHAGGYDNVTIVLLDF